jgi:hypothetical protein
MAVEIVLNIAGTMLFNPAMRGPVPAVFLAAVADSRS